MRTAFAALVALMLLGVPFAGPAGAAPGVDLSTSLFSPVDVTVPDSPVQVSVGVRNQGTATATNVVVDVPVPVGGSVIEIPDNCSIVAAMVSCSFGSLPATGERPRGKRLPDVRSARRVRDHLERACRPAGFRRQQQRPARRRRGTRERGPRRSVRLHPRRGRDGDDVHRPVTGSRTSDRPRPATRRCRAL